MRRILYYIVGTALVFFGWHHVRQGPYVVDEDVPVAPPAAETLAVERSDSDPGYRCDGRVYCSQMRSCEEATWFLQHCPGVKMDGEGDGVPCEKQWCGHH